MLNLETTKKTANSKTEILVTDWGKFEEDSTEEFVDIGIDHFQKTKSDFGLEHGTVLEISELRSSWDRDKLLKLKSSLAKLINPSRGKGEQRFSIHLHVEEEKEKDKGILNKTEKVNGEIENFIFEKLGLKTTKITSLISEDGKLITTELRDSGILIYKITEPNEFDLLDTIDYTLYYLNHAAKVTFNNTMGIPSKDYGHVFLYKNGFRIYPFGEPGEDPLKIDARKNQGVRRFLGTREIIGQIEIFSDTEQLKETSSRGDGLIKTETYFQLERCFLEVLRRLEKYVVDVQKWGLSIEDDKTNAVKVGVTNLISKLTQSKKIVSFEYPDNFLEILNASQAKSADKVVKNLRRLASTTNNNKLLQAVDETAKRLIELKKLSDEIEKEKNSIEEEKKIMEEKLQMRDKEVELLKEASNDDIIELMSIEHHINQATYRVNEYLGDLYQTLTEDQEFKRVIQDSIDNISLENKKIASLVKFVRKANFDLLSAKVNQNLIQYIKEYIEQVYKKDKIKIINKTLVRLVSVRVKGENVFNFEFVPLEINIILDNLLDNSFKASAPSVDILMEIKEDTTLIIDYRDTGVGINPTIKDRIFKFGATTTKGGTGIGMHHVEKIIKSMGGTIYLRDSSNGANFIIEIKKK
jgi:signal transduction histidine kinase